MNIRFPYSLLCCLFFLLGGCGFHLAGNAPMPPELNNLYLSYKSISARTGLSLAAALKANQVTLVNDAEQADFILKIIDTHEKNNLQGTGNIQETRRYTLTSTLRYLISDKTGHTIYGPVQIASSASLYVYSGQVIGNNQETVTIFQSLEQQNIQKVLLMLSSKNAFDIFQQHALASSETNES